MRYTNNSLNLMPAFRTGKLPKVIAIKMACILLLQTVFSIPAIALTSGPSQPEVQSFTPIGVTDMVDPASGDFSYQIPLMDVGGYPLNLAYQSGITMDQEASWVGLGWNLTPGAIVRNMRGIPDDFDGDEITQNKSMKPEWSLELLAGLDVEFVGLPTPVEVEGGVGININNYNGIKPMANVNLGLNSGGPLDASLGLSVQPGEIEVRPSVSYGQRLKRTENNELSMGGSVGLSINTQQGLKNVNLQAGLSNKNRLKENQSQSASVGAAIDMVYNHHIPRAPHPRLSTKVGVKVQLGATVMATDPQGFINGTYTNQQIIDNTIKSPAFGYMHADAQNYTSPQAILDFNRENDKGFSNATNYLSVTNHTYDVFSITGQGVGGTFRAFRGDVGHVYDPKFLADISAGVDISLEIGGGTLVKIGTDPNGFMGFNDAGDWKKNNEVYNDLKFRTKGSTPDYEPYYFKQVGELAVDDDNLYDKFGGFKVVKPNLKREIGDVSLKRELIYEDGEILNGNMTKTHRGQRVKRNQLISVLTREELADLATTPLPSNENAQPHHIAEITVLKDNGTRYVYGEPVYNIHQEEVTFNISGREFQPDCETGLVNFNPSGDDGFTNTNGRDHYFESTILPPYAHSFMLSQVLSHDYVDVKEDGPTTDDLGNYTLFRYTEVEDYKWRVPFELGMANYNEVIRSDDNDDRGSYIYGEKDLKYLERIETKTHVAVFHTSSRQDAQAVQGTQGGMDVGNPVSMLKLDKIELFATPDWKKNGSNATPLKTVHFEYNYSLCKGIPNSLDANSPDPRFGGKLTLKKVWFTYQQSHKGKFTPYTFVYGDADHNGFTDPGLNPEYNMKAYDIWGSYKPSEDDCTTMGAGVPNPEFPYVEQDQGKADDYTQAWDLTDISLPSGGKIKVDYESDDYAFVQDKRAMQMFEVVAANADPEYFTGELPAGTLTALYNTPEESAFVNNYLYFKADPNIDLYDNYIRQIMEEQGGLMYFRFLTQTDNKLNHDYIPGYAKIESYGRVEVEGYEDYAYVQLEKVKATASDIEKTAHPVSKAAWQFTRMNNPILVDQILPIDNPLDALDGSLVEGKIDKVSGEIIDVVLNLFDPATYTDLYNYFVAPNAYLREQSVSIHFIKGKSWIRLSNPNGKKLGGGCRVKRISISDEWADMTTDAAYTSREYGQEYSYTLPDGSSSGVATFESMQSKENPLVQPLFLDKANLLAPDNTHYIEAPLGVSFYPSPKVTYNKVTVRNLTKTYDAGGATPESLILNNTGSRVYEYYTTQDFPTLTKTTSLSVKRDFEIDADLANLIFGTTSGDDLVGVAQGYAIITNDMNGKPKAEWTYAEGQSTPLKGVEYRYKEQPSQFADPSGTVPGQPVYVRQKLVNDCVVINPDGSTGVKQIGVEFDVVADFRQSTTRDIGAGVAINLNTITIPFVPFVFPLPSAWPAMSYSQRSFKSAVVTKVINQYGILDEVIAHDNGAQVKTRNLAWDAATGEVLVTETTNAFEDKVYHFKYPAHWAYDGMGQASDNIGFSVEANAVGTIINPYDIDVEDHFVRGDELLIYVVMAGLVQPGGAKGWVLNVDEVSNELDIIDADGNLFDYNPATDLLLKVVRSGRRNQQANAIGTLVLKTNPLDPDGDGTVDPIDINTFLTDASLNADAKILQAQAMEFSEHWKMKTCNIVCNPDCTGEPTVGDVINPFQEGVRGIWRPLRNHVFLTDRQQAPGDLYTTSPADVNAPPDLREDGTYEAFSSFWTPSLTMNTWDKNETGWTWATKMTCNDGSGHETENIDALNRYSAAVFGYNEDLPVIVATNARSNQLAFDSFEDYYDLNEIQLCQEHFKFESYDTMITNEDAHTGLHSIRLEQGEQIEKIVDLSNGLPDEDCLNGVYDNVPYTIKTCDVIDHFEPQEVFDNNEPTERGSYVFSYWVKRGMDENYTAVPTVLLTTGPTQSSNLLDGVTPQVSMEIDGWQQFEYLFDLPENTGGTLTIGFNNPANTENTFLYIDDLRINPFYSSVKSFVYDPIRYRLMAELDGNNYATFYDYDEQGQLARVKKETERGVYTIQESFSHLVKQPNN